MLKGKTALVTGSTSGIGLGIADCLARQGANIVLNGFGDHEAPRKHLEAHGVRVGYHGADMSKPAEIEAMMQMAASEFVSVAGGCHAKASSVSGSSASRYQVISRRRW